MAYRVAVVGATGAVGREIIKTLVERNFPVSEVIALASGRSTGSEISFGDKKVLTVRNLDTFDFTGCDFGLFSPGASISAIHAPRAAAQGCIVIDNTSHFRMDPDVPLVVPEVNPEALRHFAKKNIIANPNCSTIQMVVALKPLHDAARIKHIVVSTYQATSGKGHNAVTELETQARAFLAGEPMQAKVFPGPIAFNVLSEWKMVHETRKIMGDPSIGISPTTARVPVVNGHSESIHVVFHRPMDAEEAKALLRKAEGVILVEGPYAPGNHPQPITASGTDPVYVGRVRNDLAVPGALSLWVVSDNLRKGAALNAVQIAERVLG
jgi:aspartate-semialdehyde dehydrogenase